MKIDRFQHVLKIGNFRIEKSEAKKVILDLNKVGQGEKIRGLVEIKNTDLVDVKIDAKLTAPQTSCEIIIYVIASGSAKVNIDVNILVGQKALGSNASLKVLTLILGGTPKITVLPKMEVLNKDSRAVHGVSTMRLSKESLFYAQSRGLDEQKIKQLLVENIYEHQS